MQAQERRRSARWAPWWLYVIALVVANQVRTRWLVPDDLAHHNCLSFGSQANQARGWLFKYKGQVHAVRVKGNLACSDGSVLHEWTLAGYGLAWRSMWEVREDLAAGRLVSVLDDYAAPSNGIFALLAERKHLPLRVRAFVDLLKSHYGQASYWDSC